MKNMMNGKHIYLKEMFYVFRLGKLIEIIEKESRLRTYLNINLL